MDRDTEVLAVNVRARADGIVGARFWAPDTNNEPAETNAWQFPLRVVRDNVPMPLEQAMLHMSSHTRRTAILLENIPRDRRAKIMIAHRKPFTPGTLFAPFPGELCGYSIASNSVQLRSRETGFPADTETPANVPLDDVEAVWADTAGTWFVRVAGHFEWIEMFDEDNPRPNVSIRVRKPALHYIPPLGPVLAERRDKLAT